MQNDVEIVLPDNISKYNTVINETISEKDVTDAIKSLKNNKACGGANF